jgi:ATP-dependent protease ClpP protease subunit
MSERNPEIDAAELRLADLKAKQIQLEINAMERMAAISVAEPAHTGRFTFVGPVSENSVHGKIRDMESYARRYPGGDVHILMNSMGGHVWDGFALIDYIQQLQAAGHKVTITGIGVVASMAGIIMQAADERVLTPRAWFHAHELSSMVAGSVTSQEDNLKLVKAMQQQAADLLCSKSSLTPAKLKSLWTRKEAYMGAAEALKLGLIDRIEGK